MNIIKKLNERIKLNITQKIMIYLLKYIPWKNKRVVKDEM